MNPAAVAAFAFLLLLLLPPERGQVSKVGRRTPAGRVEPLTGAPRRAAHRLSYWLVNLCRRLGVRL